MENSETAVRDFVKQLYMDDNHFDGEHLSNAIFYVFVNSNSTMKENNEQWCKYEDLPDSVGLLLTALHVDVVDVLMEYVDELRLEDE